MITAFKDHVKGFEIVLKQLFSGKYWLYFLPGFIVLLIFLPWFILSSSVAHGTGILNDVPLIGNAVSGLLNSTMGFFDLIVMSILNFVVLTVLSPFNSLLSEKLDNNITGQSFHGGILRMITDMGRAAMIAVVAIVMELILLGLWWIFSWISGAEILDGIVYFIIGSFFFGFSFYDYSLERYAIGFGSSWTVAFGKFSYMLLTGAFFQILMMIPYIGVVVAPVLATMLATIIYLKLRVPEGKFPTE